MTMSVGGVLVTYPADQLGEGGSIPTPTLFRKADWWVEACDLGLARKLVEQWHYAAGGSNTAVYSHALLRRGAFWSRDAAGAAWWIPPITGAAYAQAGVGWEGVLALSRLVIVPGVPSNACSFLVRHSMRLIDRKRWPILLTYADEWRGHDGRIYLAAGWKEDGYTKPERCYVKDGRMVSRKAGPKTRTHAEMLALGCECVGKYPKKRFVDKV